MEDSKTWLEKVASEISVDIPKYPFGMTVYFSPTLDEIEKVYIESLEFASPFSCCCSTRLKEKDKEKIKSLTLKWLEEERPSLEQIKRIMDTLDSSEVIFLDENGDLNFSKCEEIEVIKPFLSETERFIRNFKRIFNKEVLKVRILSGKTLPDILYDIKEELENLFPFFVKVLLKGKPKKIKEVFKEMEKEIIKERTKELREEIESLKFEEERIRTFFEKGDFFH